MGSCNPEFRFLPRLIPHLVSPPGGEQEGGKGALGLPGSPQMVLLGL